MTNRLKIKNTLKMLTMSLGVTLSTSSILFAANPEHLEHPHGPGTFMVEYQFMRMNMDGIRTGSTDIAVEDVTAANGLYNHLMSPTAMTMDMHMLMPMYNITEDISVMIMAMYTKKSMDMINRAGAASIMETSGIGDTEVGFNYKFLDNQLAASFGLSIPTGSVEATVLMNNNEIRAPYAMQLGSGTFDAKPSITYLGAFFDLRYGAQGSYTYRIGENSAGYAQGNSIDFQTWIRKTFFNVVFSADLKFKYSGEIDGKDDLIMQTMTMPTGMTGRAAPPAIPTNYGGKTAVMGFGVAYPISMFNIGIKAGVPVYQNLNGLQMKHKWSAAVNLTAMY